ncbi:MAG: SUMF1/EgtB/PvdO family nonheme iron enzyme [Thermoguttaceae bacterium]|nr:SUMF1/EgtB/PvdO family nonheme iron enzyme [Thermoguttaceae bacterium]
MKQLSLLFFAWGLLLAMPFASAQVIKPVESSELDSYCKINIAELPNEQIYPAKKLNSTFFKDKLIVLYNNLVIPDIVNGKIVANTQEDQYKTQKTLQDIQSLNKLQKLGLSSGQFVVIAFGFVSDNNEVNELNFLKKVAQFPVYETVILKRISDIEFEGIDSNDFFLVDSSGNFIASYKDGNQCLQGLKHYLSAVEDLKRIKSLPVQHPLDSLNLSFNEIDLLVAFEPGKPWLESYKKLENAIAKMSDNSRKELMEKVKTSIDSYISKTIPEICESAQTLPATNLEKLVLLSKSIKGMPGEEMVNNALTQIQEDKNIAELAKIISAINKFKASANSSKGLKKKTEPFIASLRKTIDKADVSKEIKAEAVETLEQLIAFLPEDEVPLELKKYLHSVKLKANNKSSEQIDDEIADSEDDVPNRNDNADKRTGDYPGKRIVITINGVDFAFRYCPPGTFLMGSPPGEYGHKKDEKQHRVTFTKGFWIMETEVTFGMFKAFVQETGYQSIGNVPEVLSFIIIEDNPNCSWMNPGYTPEDNYPVTCVSWFDTAAFCTWLSKKTGKKVLIPTESQWEYACRAGTTGPYAGNLDEMAWYDSNSERKIHPVGTKAPNAWGIIDMHGNVSEWCIDYYGAYPGKSVKNPLGPSNGSGRVVRSCCWLGISEFCRSAARISRDPKDRASILGFRCVIVP